MVNYAADDVATIRARLAEISKVPELETATGEVLDWFAAKHDVTRVRDEGDSCLRIRTKCAMNGGSAA